MRRNYKYYMTLINLEGLDCLSTNLVFVLQFLNLLLECHDFTLVLRLHLDQFVIELLVLLLGLLQLLRQVFFLTLQLNNVLLQGGQTSRLRMRKRRVKKTEEYLTTSL